MKTQGDLNSTVIGPSSSRQNTDDSYSEDVRVLKTLTAVVDALRLLLGSACSCEIARLEQGQLRVIKSTNPEDLGLTIQMSEEEAARLQDNVHVSESGKSVRTVAVPVNSGDRLIGRMLVTVDLSIPLIDLLEQIGSMRSESSEVAPVKSSDDLVRSTLDQALRATAAQRGISYQSKNKMVVKDLYDAGIFEVRGAIDTVAGELGVSRYTIYNYLREVRE